MTQNVTPLSYKGWLVEFDHPPIPCRNFDWVATHPLYDPGQPNTDLLLQAATRRELVAAIDAWPADVDHPDNAAVDAFAEKMKAKMATSRAKGREGWDDPARCSPDTLVRLMYAHAKKGDPVDVANYCMMLDHYKASTSLLLGVTADQLKCKYCDGTGYYDYAGFSMDPCHHCGPTA